MEIYGNSNTIQMTKQMPSDYSQQSLNRISYEVLLWNMTSVRFLMDTVALSICFEKSQFDQEMLTTITQ